MASVKQEHLLHTEFIYISPHSLVNMIVEPKIRKRRHLWALK